jgi:hypothetical protein
MRVFCVISHDRRSVVLVGESDSEQQLICQCRVWGVGGEVISISATLRLLPGIPESVVREIPFNVAMCGLIDVTTEESETNDGVFDRELRISLRRVWTTGLDDIEPGTETGGYPNIRGPYGVYQNFPYHFGETYVDTARNAPVYSSFSCVSASSPNLPELPLRLSEGTRAQIRLEEEYRTEVRRSVENTATAPKSRLITFLNSAFGIWLLSSVLLGLFAWSWQHINASMEEERAIITTIRKIRVELDNRDTVLVRATRPTMPARFRDVMRTAIYGVRPGLQEHPTWKLFYAAIYPEFSPRSYRSLVVELAALDRYSLNKSLQTDLNFIEEVMEEFSVDRVDDQLLVLPNERRQELLAALDRIRTWTRPTSVR